MIENRISRDRKKQKFYLQNLFLLFRNINFVMRELIAKKLKINEFSKKSRRETVIRNDLIKKII